MSAFSIGLSVPASTETIGTLLREWFPSLGVLTWQASMELSGEWPEIVYEVIPRAAPDFVTHLAFSVFPGDDAITVSLSLARRFARALGCKTYSDGTGYGDSGTPYWCIVWDGEHSFLGDDCGSAFVDGTAGGAVRVVRELSVSVRDLDSNARLI